MLITKMTKTTNANDNIQLSYKLLYSVLRLLYIEGQLHFILNGMQELTCLVDGQTLRLPRQNGA